MKKYVKDNNLVCTDLTKFILIPQNTCNYIIIAVVAILLYIRTCRSSRATFLPAVATNLLTRHVIIGASVIYIISIVVIIYRIIHF